MPCQCSVCQKWMRRKKDSDRGPLRALQVIHTRTLVGNDLLPSCSEVCAEVLRGKQADSVTRRLMCQLPL